MNYDILFKTLFYLKNVPYYIISSNVISIFLVCTIYFKIIVLLFIQG